MARAHRSAVVERPHALLGTPPRLRVRPSVHAQRDARLDRRRNERNPRVQPVLAPRHRNFQIRVRKTHRPRRPFTL